MGRIQNITEKNIENCVKRELKHWEQKGQPKTETEVRKIYVDIAHKAETAKQGKIHNE